MGRDTNRSKKGWYIPSRAEWAAFGGEIAEKLGITISDYRKFDLSVWYWYFSQNHTYRAWYADFYNGFMYYSDVISSNSVRLATTF